MLLLEGIFFFVTRILCPLFGCSGSGHPELQAWLCVKGANAGQEFRLPGWICTLEAHIKKTSEWTADHKGEMATEEGSGPPRTPPPRSMFFSYYASFVSVYLPGIQAGYRQTRASLLRSLAFCSLDGVDSRGKKATSGSLKGSTYTSKSPTESSWIMTEACPPSERMAVFVCLLMQPPAGHTKRLSGPSSAVSLNQVTAIRLQRWLAGRADLFMRCSLFQSGTMERGSGPWPSSLKYWWRYYTIMSLKWKHNKAYWCFHISISFSIVLFNFMESGAQWNGK